MSFSGDTQIPATSTTAGAVIVPAGAGLSVDASGNLTNTDKGSSQNIFKNFAVQGDGTSTASTNNDTLTFAPGSFMTMTSSANVVTFTATVKGPKKHRGKHRDGSFDPDVDMTAPEDTLTFIEGSGIGLTTDSVNKTITIRQKNSITNAGSVGSGTVTVDMAVSDVVLITVTGNFTIAFTNITAGAEVTVLVKNTGTNNRTVTHGVAAGNTNTGSSTAVVGSVARTGIFKYISLGTTTTDLYCQINVV